MNIATIRKYFIMRYILLLAIGAVLSIMLVFSPQARAQSPADNIQITLSPTNRTMKIAPGNTYNGSFAIFNSGDMELDFNVYAAPYRVKNQNYDPLFTEPTDSTKVDRTQISRWVTFAETEYTLKPGESVDVAYTINTPASIPDGGQYAALFAQTKSSETSSINSQKRVGMLLYAHSNGEAINKGSSQNPNLSFWQTAPTFSVSQDVTNDGNTDFAAEVKMSISDIFGNEKYTAETSKVILPDTTRSINLDWKHTPSLSLMKVKTSVKIFDKTTNYSHTVLFATPTAIFGLVAILILVIAGGIYVFKRQSSNSTKNNT